MRLHAIHPGLGKRRGRPLHFRSMRRGLGDRSGHCIAAVSATISKDVIKYASYWMRDASPLDESRGSEKNGMADARDMWGSVASALVPSAARRECKR